MKLGRILMIYLFSFTCSTTLLAKEVQNVEVINTPDVNVVNTPTVNVGNTVTIDNVDVPVTILNDSSNPVPVDVQGGVVTTQRVPIAMSGTWQGSGLTIPSMILHDLIFYIEADNGNLDCSFTMSFVINQTTARRLYTRTLTVDNGVEFHYEAGIDTSHLRFGTVGSGTACDVNWAAMGFAVE
jgi:hypothetical protein